MHACAYVMHIEGFRQGRVYSTHLDKRNEENFVFGNSKFVLSANYCYSDWIKVINIKLI